MRLYGYKNSSRSSQGEPMPLTEATLVASPSELRQIASFLQSAALRMEHMGPAFDHEHLADLQPGFADSPSFVVAAASEV
jgi:hypothetical protein